jgi:hypothetical protein
MKPTPRQLMQAGMKDSRKDKKIPIEFLAEELGGEVITPPTPEQRLKEAFHGYMKTKNNEFGWETKYYDWIELKIKEFYED